MRSVLALFVGILSAGCVGESEPKWKPAEALCDSCEIRREDERIPHPLLEITHSVVELRSPDRDGRFEKYVFSKAGRLLVAFLYEDEPTWADLVRETQDGTIELLSSKDLESEMFREVASFLKGLGITKLKFPEDRNSVPQTGDLRSAELGKRLAV